MTLTSSAGFLALLDEKEAELKRFALLSLNAVVDQFWPEIADSLTKIEELCEDGCFEYNQLSSLVVSKVYYHLGGFDDSISFALGAGSLFDVTSRSEYVEVIISKCIDQYTKLRVQQFSHPDDPVFIDERLESIVKRMLERCFTDRQYKQAIGIALETRDLNVFERAIRESDDTSSMLDYGLKMCLSLVHNRELRSDVLERLVDVYLTLDEPDYINVCQCYVFLSNSEAVAELLLILIKREPHNWLVAYQVAFDMYESATQDFLQGVKLHMMPSMAEGDTAKEPKNSDDAMEIDNDPLQQRLGRLVAILGGETTIDLTLEFLIRNNHSDLAILKNTRDATRNSVCHTAIVIANGYMCCGTTIDSFLRDNLEWLGKATNWARFSAIASLGLIHKGHEKESLSIMSTYLPKESGSPSIYSDGGALFALGLIHANHGGKISEYLLNQLKGASNEAVRHGGCLGLGLAAMGTAEPEIYDQLRMNLYMDDAVTGEAAGLAMGLVMVGSSDPRAIDEMVKYCKETQHEKILRGLAVGIALIMLGQLEKADALIETLSTDKDPLLRRSGMFTIAMAYCGSGDNNALRKLLHVAVSDVDNDVRRSAVMSVGFVLFHSPEQCPPVVSLLAESYNPHVRCGAAMALGIACAGTGLKEALNVLEPMVNDPANFVRQAVFIASAMILMQQTEAANSKVKTFRELYTKSISDKHEDTMAKFGAILSQGIIDAGGRNVTISLQSSSGHVHLMSVVGTLVFTQFWYWFPFSHFLSLAFRPTAIIGLNSDLKMPKIEFRSNARPSLYAYPEPLQAPKEKEREKVATAVLSITAKAKAKAKKAEEARGSTSSTSMETDQQPEPGKAPESTSEEKAKEEVEQKQPEPSFQMLQNPSRVVPSQLRVLTVAENSRYEPIKAVTVGGILMLIDTKSEQPEELVEPLKVPTVAKVDDEGPEPEPPEPFEYIED
ncbi:26S proteasome non-ATPase regulatory subunit 1-like [Oscarella lobularis]|uniref:26S proteasome non-ATPase regulatory subunit 1-like n=1 Tax=Oscarella lobularis TaxID=121494 RepID=UPI003313C101